MKYSWIKFNSVFHIRIALSSKPAKILQIPVRITMYVCILYVSDAGTAQLFSHVRKKAGQ